MSFPVPWYRNSYFFQLLRSVLKTAKISIERQQLYFTTMPRNWQFHALQLSNCLTFKNAVIHVSPSHEKYLSDCWVFQTLTKPGLKDKITIYKKNTFSYRACILKFILKRSIHHIKTALFTMLLDGKEANRTYLRLCWGQL